MFRAHGESGIMSKDRRTVSKAIERYECMAVSNKSAQVLSIFLSFSSLHVLTALHAEIKENQRWYFSVQVSGTVHVGVVGSETPSMNSHVGYVEKGARGDYPASLFVLIARLLVDVVVMYLLLLVMRVGWGFHCSSGSLMHRGRTIKFSAPVRSNDRVGCLVDMVAYVYVSLFVRFYFAVCLCSVFPIRPYVLVCESNFSIVCCYSLWFLIYCCVYQV